MNWLSNNYSWIFSGIGVFVISIIIGLFIKRRKKKFTQYQKSGKNSINLQSKGDITFGDKKTND